MERLSPEATLFFARFWHARCPFHARKRPRRLNLGQERIPAWMVGRRAGLGHPFISGFDPARPYPAVLVFGGGPQTVRMPRTEAERWRSEAERRSYIVVSPATPDGSLFFEAADRIFPSFIEMILHSYKVAGRMHIAGLSNGGISAFHVAARYPQYFSTLTGYPGLLDGGDVRLASAIKPMCIFMHAGDRDTSWRSALEAQSKELAARGFSVRFGVEKNEDHVIRAVDLAARMFDEIERCPH